MTERADPSTAWQARPHVVERCSRQPFKLAHWRRVRREENANRIHRGRGEATGDAPSRRVDHEARRAPVIRKCTRVTTCLCQRHVHLRTRIVTWRGVWAGRATQRHPAVARTHPASRRAKGGPKPQETRLIPSHCEGCCSG